jgi:hypothetical protein
MSDTVHIRLPEPERLSRSAGERGCPADEVEERIHAAHLVVLIVVPPILKPVSRSAGFAFFPVPLATSLALPALEFGNRLGFAGAATFHHLIPHVRARIGIRPYERDPARLKDLTIKAIEDIKREIASRSKVSITTFALRAHADRFAFRPARVSRSSAKRKNCRLVERYISRSSKFEALWYSRRYSSARRRHSAMRSFTGYDIALSCGPTYAPVPSTLAPSPTLIVVSQGGFFIFHKGHR